MVTVLKSLTTCFTLPTGRGVESGSSPTSTLCRIGTGEYPLEHIGEISQPQGALAADIIRAPGEIPGHVEGMTVISPLLAEQRALRGSSVDTAHTHSWLLTIALRVHTSIPGSLNLNARGCGHLSVPSGDF